MLENLTSTHFGQHINQLFQLTFKGTAAANLRLLSVEEFPKSAHNNSLRTPFSLLFCADDNMAIADNCFTLKHPTLGDLPEIYVNRILPPDPRDTRPHYQAVFN